MRIARAVLVLFFYLAAFFAAGLLMPARVHKNRPAAIGILGFFVYFSLFEVIALPMKMTLQKLSTLTGTWFAVLLAVLVFDLLFRRESLREILRSLTPLRELPRRTGVWGAAAFAASAGIALLLGININHISDYDAGYYLGLPGGAIYSNLIENFDPYTGWIRDHVNAYYFLNTNTDHCAVMGQALGIHPLLEEKFTMTIALSLLFSLIIYQAGRLLFAGEKKYASLFYLGSMLVLLFSYSISGTSQYYAYRTYEGKAVCATVYIAGVFLCFLAVFFEEAAWGWTTLFFVMMSAPAFSNTSLFVLPVMAVTSLLPVTAARRRWKDFARLCACLIPWAVWVVIYLKFGD